MGFGLDWYEQAARRARKLGREEELHLARRWLTHRDEKARQMLVEAHLQTVLAIAIKLRHYGTPVSDLVAEGNLGLLHAIDRFEPERGLRLTTYASHWIRARMISHLLDTWSIVRTGAGALRTKVFFKLRRERAKLNGQLGDPELVREKLAERMGVTPNTLDHMLRQLDGTDVSFALPTDDESGASIGSRLEFDGIDAEVQMSQGQVRDYASELVNPALKTLDERERFIVTHRLLADRGDELTLAELGRRLGVSRERARQLEARAKDKLRTRIERSARKADLDIADLAA